MVVAISVCSEQSPRNGWQETRPCFNCENVKPNERIGSRQGRFGTGDNGDNPTTPLARASGRGVATNQRPCSVQGLLCDTWGNNVERQTQTIAPSYLHSR